MITISYWDSVKKQSVFRDIKFTAFSGGEEHINITPFNAPLITIKVRLTSSSEIMQLLLVTDSLRRMGNQHINLVMPYIPYARQDRVCQIGDSFSLKVFANLINSQNYDRVHVADSHSSVATALLNNVVESPQSKFAKSLRKYCNKNNIEPYDYVIAPDAGASKKAVDFASVLNEKDWNVEVIQALKIRDKSGEIISTTVLHDDFTGKRCLMVDDICGSGSTFIALTNALKDRGATFIGLFVTHGIFSQGVDILFENGVSTIYTTDSFTQRSAHVRVIHNFID